MNSKAKNYLIILLVLATVSSGLIAWNQSQRLAALETNQLKTSTAANVTKHKSAQVVAKSSSNATLTSADAEAVGPSDATETESKQRKPKDRLDFAALMAIPEFAQAIAIEKKAGLDARYADLFKQLKLPPDQLEKFKALLLERQTARTDVYATARDQGLDPRANRDELKKMTDAAQAEVDAAIKTSLGESVFNQYEAYDNSKPQRALLTQVNSILGYSSTPLNETQSAFLLNALGTGATNTNDQGGGPGNWGGGGTATITDAVIDQAKAVLFPAQVDVLKQIQAEQQAQQTIHDYMRANSADSGKPGKTGGSNKKSK